MLCPFCHNPFSTDFRGANWAYVHSKVMLHLLRECPERTHPCDEASLRASADDIADSLTQQGTYRIEERDAATPSSNAPQRR